MGMRFFVSLVLGVTLLSGALAAIFLWAQADNARTYDFDPNDPSVTYEVASSMAELVSRLDASGLRHGGRSGRYFSTVSGWYDVSIDNNCATPEVEVVGVADGVALRLDRLSAQDECKKRSGRQELIAEFEREVVARLRNEAEPMLLKSVVKGERFYYPSDGAPTLAFPGSFADLAARLDESSLLAHEVHDGLYQLGEIACFGTFRVVEDMITGQATIIGVGYSMPCPWGTNQAELEDWFRIALGVHGDLAPKAPSPSALAICMPAVAAGEPKPVSPPGLDTLIEPCPAEDSQ